jgi:hypothetical protein
LPSTRWTAESRRLGARPAAALAAAGALAAGIFLALHHPTQPHLALILFALWCAAAMRWAGLWLFVLPACLPAADFAPWTGWIAFDEFDLVVMGAATAGFVRLARPVAGHGQAAGAAGARALPRLLLIVALLCTITATLAFVRGATASGAAAMSWYDGYASPLNALRTSKSLFYAVLLTPLLHDELRRSGCAAARRVAWGMLAGTLIVVLAVCWERAAYPGLFDLAQPYRTVALFWEMHVGGAAIDGYLAMAWPIAAWAVARSRTPLPWTMAAALALLVEYACLTTFSRGLYLSICGSLIVLAIGLSRRGAAPSSPPWRRYADAALLVAVALQGAAILGTESFMLARMKHNEDDLVGRLAHWHNGLRLLPSLTDWWFGRGSGRLPAEYAAAVAQHEWSGAAQIVSDADGRHLSLRGPGHIQALAGLYALTQRLPIEPIAYRVGFDARADKAVRVGVSVCETHLLYEGACQRGVAQVLPGAGAWQRVNLLLQGSRLPSSAWPPRTAVFAVTVLDANAQVELDNFMLGGDGSANVLRNADFSQELAHWFPVAKDYFVPWHIDNLYLELLIEQGLAGLTTFALLLGSALATLLSPRQRDFPLAPYLAASLAGALLVGLVSSLLDVPRVAFLLFFIAFMSIQLGTARKAFDPQ